MPMDSSLHSAHLPVDEVDKSHEHDHETGVQEEEPHIHLPNPSWWPMLLSGAIVLGVTGLFFMPDNPWLLVVSVPLIIAGIMGWALEDPMAPLGEHAVASQDAQDAQSRFVIGQNVVDQSGQWIGIVQARFDHYILVDNDDLFMRAYYIPKRLFSDEARHGDLRLIVNEEYLLKKGLDQVPDDLYEDVPEYGVPQIKGVPMFAHSPLSPAETGHYNYGPNFPGINTDAANSYRPEEVRPIPQRYVADRRNLQKKHKPVAPQMVPSHS